MDEQFKRYGKDEIDSLGLPYDYGSIMHYGPYAFSVDRTSKILILKYLIRIICIC